MIDNLRPGTSQEVAALRLALTSHKIISPKGIYWQRGLRHPSEKTQRETREFAKYLIYCLARAAGKNLWELDTPDYTNIRLPEIGTNLRSLYRYFCVNEAAAKGEMPTPKYILRFFGLPNFDSLDLTEQLAALKISKQQGKRIPWQTVPLKTQRYLVEKLAAICQKQAWQLEQADYKNTTLPEVATTLYGMYQYYGKQSGAKIPTSRFIADALGLPTFDSLSIVDQLVHLKKSVSIVWSSVPLATQKYLVQQLAVLKGKEPFELTPENYESYIEEIGRTLWGMYNYYLYHYNRGDSLENKGMSTPRLILKALGLRAFASLSVAEQVAALKKQTRIDWAIVPIETQRYLLEKLGEIIRVGPTHPWQFTTKELKLEVEEIGSSLKGLYLYYQNHPDRMGKAIMPFIMERLGIEKPENMPRKIRRRRIHKDQSRRQWGEMSIREQRQIVESLARQHGKSIWGLSSADFLGAVSETEGATLATRLYYYYRDRHDRQQRTILKFMFDALGFGTAPFNPVGRLFVTSKARVQSKSMYFLLSKVRELVRLWQKNNPGKSVTQITRQDLLDIMLSEKKMFKGFVGAVLFKADPNLSFIDLICLALQHIPLDELDPFCDVADQSNQNFLQPSMFVTYNLSSAETRRLEFLVGQYTEEDRVAELPLLLEVLDKCGQAQSRRVSIEEELLDNKWLETQRLALTGILERIKINQSFSAPLRYALGIQGETTELQPKSITNGNIFAMRLNPSQAAAARLILEDSNPLAVIHGPAGSGKTYLLEKVVEHLVRDGKRVLYVCPTHKATDVFLDRIDRYGSFRDLPVLRLGISDEKFSVAARSYWVREPAARENFKRNRAGSKGCLFVGTIAAGVNFLVDEGAKGMRQSLFSEWVGGMRIERDISDYDVVIIDEASMATKPESYAALALAKRAVLIGDHVQLEPFPLERGRALKLGLNDRETELVERSLLEELMLADFPHILLDRNYRAINPVMIVLASRIFYDERIMINQESRYFKLAKDERQWTYPADSLKIVDTSNLPYAQKRESFVGTSYCNHQEAALVVREVEHLIDQGFGIDDIAIITPYQAQVELIISALQRALPKVAQAYFKRWVSTFDGFQGDENKCVVISFVRSNPEEPPETGFVGNYHRVNVGITRAKERMCLIGDWSTLKKTGNGNSQEAALLADSLSLQTRHIFEELEAQVLELEREGRAVIEKLD